MTFSLSLFLSLFLSLCLSLFVWGLDGVDGVQQLMHAIAMVHKMQRLALSSSSMLAAPIQEEDKEETATTAKSGGIGAIGAGDDRSQSSVAVTNHKKKNDSIDIDSASPLTLSTADDGAPSSTDQPQPASRSIVDGSPNGPLVDPMDL